MRSWWIRLFLVIRLRSEGRMYLWAGIQRLWRYGDEGMGWTGRDGTKV